ncbi:MAG: endopeptidase La [Deltaproteobacteria bacterium]|jgi:ATP-dependent Lon protease|nr:endopeptidase La [Deltaproteobacteria bacterium]MBW1746937.1 endopeptidase La [Deltaproteobacteria bacterium]MBW1825768.1 endopeptidase La [Deltaproteobacteria bacterium]MBW1968715.1 endopeptidase La [Deltaproteobacteria bacterium]MBW2155972.1 endopeptidase La [Deltaproteobacteria bacterium]
MIEQQPSPELSAEKIPEVLPILPLFDAALFPKMVLPLVVMQPESIKLIDEAMSQNRLIGLIVVKKPSEDNVHAQDDLNTVGTSALILKMAKTEDNKLQLLAQGLGRFKVKKYVQEKPYLQASLEHIKEKDTKDKEIEALMSNMIDQFTRIAELSPGLPQEIVVMARSIKEPGILADMIASTINSSLEEKQKVLETFDTKKRLKEVTRLVNHQLEILELGNKIQSQVKGDMDKRQREYYLREQLKAIKEELGEKDEAAVEVEDYRAKIDEKNLPEEARKEAERELNRLSRMHPSSAEYTVASTYLDWLTVLPWHESTEDNLDIKKARIILDKDHFGLDKAKKRILEYLAVRKLKPESKGPILCFAGPPGTGKTSLGRSIAQALGRQFFRISLGGVRDEAEIRGHRRTYVGALPGRIIQGIRRSGSNNPVFMLDEIDKVGSDFRGDPSSALLEVLDPEQNFSFSDHYLDVPFDLSKVMFITTANILDTIPPALLDRMEVLKLLGYTLDEKIRIANRYLIPRQREAHGLKSKQLSFTKGAVKRIISGYTREAGLRNLEREIASICRGVAAGIAEKKVASVAIKVENISEYLGPVRLISEAKARTSIPGVATGLAWTQAGGELLFIEATSMRGSKGLTLTGQLGDVMKESATAALSFIRSNADTIGIPEDYFEKHDIHIHVPAGAIPKDGPSAGVTMLTALTSLLTHKTINKDLAMTGEITLRGQVLPIGGLKEKVLAAHRAGIKAIIIPKWNEKDLEDIPKEIQEKIRFYPVEKMQDVLKIAFQK